jgi:hypothetical protein
MAGFGPTRSDLYVYVPDCDATYKEALEAAATSTSKPEDYPHGDLYGGFKVFAGNIWWAVTHIGKKPNRMSICEVPRRLQGESNFQPKETNQCALW